MTVKSNKTKSREKFMAIRRDEETLWHVQSPLRREKNEKNKRFRSLKRMSDKFEIFSD